MIVSFCPQNIKELNDSLGKLIEKRETVQRENEKIEKETEVKIKEQESLMKDRDRLDENRIAETKIQKEIFHLKKRREIKSRQKMELEDELEKLESGFAETKEQLESEKEKMKKLEEEFEKTKEEKKRRNEHFENYKKEENSKKKEMEEELAKLKQSLAKKRAETDELKSLIAICLNEYKEAQNQMRINKERAETQHSAEKQHLAIGMGNLVHRKIFCKICRKLYIATLHSIVSTL